MSNFGIKCTSLLISVSFFDTQITLKNVYSFPSQGPDGTPEPGAARGMWEQQRAWGSLGAPQLLPAGHAAGTCPRVGSREVYRFFSQINLVGVDLLFCTLI